MCSVKAMVCAQQRHVCNLTSNKESMKHGEKGGQVEVVHGAVK